MWVKAPLSILQWNNALKSTQTLQKHIWMYAELVTGFKPANYQMGNLFKEISDSASEDQRGSKATMSR